MLKEKEANGVVLGASAILVVAAAEKNEEAAVAVVGVGVGVGCGGFGAAGVVDGLNALKPLKPLKTLGAGLSDSSVADAAAWPALVRAPKAYFTVELELAKLEATDQSIVHRKICVLCNVHVHKTQT